MTMRRMALVSTACALTALVLQARANAGAIDGRAPVPRSLAASRTPLDLRRAPEQTYLTYPEWFLVYSPDEYADLIADRSPSMFPYLGHIGQLWQSYRAIHRASKDDYPFNSEYHVMIVVIATSTTIEYALKGAYEVVVGRTAELLRRQPTIEDRLAARVARDYVDFLDAEPWYEFDFLTPLRQTWADTGWIGVDALRKFERKYFLTTEYAAKAAYGWAIRKSSESAYGVPESTTSVLLDRMPGNIGADLRDLKVLKTNEDGSVLATVPRYQAFTAYAQSLAAANVTFLEIAGNAQPLLVSAIVPDRFDASGLTMLMSQPILTRPGLRRILFTVRAQDLSSIVRMLDQPGCRLEHVYDY